MNLTQAPLFSFDPNWSNDVIYEIEFATEIIESRSGREQRRSLRRLPNESLTFTLLDYEQNPTRVQDYLFNAYDNFIPVINWTKGSEITSNITSTLNLKETSKWFVTGRDVVVVSGINKHKTTIASFSGTQLVLSIAPPFTLLSTAMVYPVVIAEPISEVNLDNITAFMSEGEVQFDAVNGLKTPIASNGTIALDGREIYQHFVNWSKNPIMGFENSISKSSFNNGVAYYRDKKKRPIVYLDTQFSSWNTNQAWELELMFRRMRGRQGEFFASTNVSDFIVKSKTSNTFTIQGVDFYNSYYNSKIHKGVAVKDTEGGYAYNKIISITTSAGDSIITFQNSWLTTKSVSQLDCVSWLFLCRFASDNMSFSWTNQNVCDTSVKLQVLEYLTAE